MNTPAQTEESALSPRELARQKTRADLDWHRIERAVADRCRGPLAHRLDLTIHHTEDGAWRSLAETGEVLELLRADERLPLDGASEIRAHLSRLRKGGALSAPELRDIMKALGCARSLRRFLATRKDRLPKLRGSCGFDPSLDNLLSELEMAIDENGQLLDNASSELKRLRNEIAVLRGRIIRRLEAMIIERESVLQDRFYTEREGRYVLPVRRDAHERLSGIVHGSSSSGASIFVEPQEIVNQGNRLKMAISELAREEARILAELSEITAESVASLAAAADAIDHADLRQASALLGLELGAQVPERRENATLRFKRGRHPVLALDGVDVVPCDIEIAAGEGIIISGPNAGGKTVSLKTAGLFAMMARAGIPLPAEEVALGFFPEVLSVVGDDQSIQSNLSTFSAHVTHLSRICKVAKPGSLILLDELASGTDPKEGAALAAALVQHLLGRDAAMLVTTHYEALKVLAADDARLRNASVGFDVEKMLPTFELIWGVPGQSGALVVAERYGLPEAVVSAAKAGLPEGARRYEAMAQSLLEKERALSVARDQAEERKVQLTKRSAKLDERAKKLEERQEQVLDKEASKLKRELQELRGELRKAKKALRTEGGVESIESARKRIEEAAAKAATLQAEAKAEVGALKEGELAIGQRVYVAHLKSEATIVDVMDGGKVRVAVGAIKVIVDSSKLGRADRRAASKTATSRGRSQGRSGGGRLNRARTPRTSDNTLDLRGMRADDAVGMLGSFLDRLFGADLANGYIVHGRGTGALRRAVREALDRDETYLHKYENAAKDEGGDAVTVLYFR